VRALLAVVALAACAGESRPPPQPAAAEPSVWRVRGPGGLEPIEPGTRDPALLRASACASCHPAEHAEWASSRHAAAWTNGIFQREYRDVPRRWCVHCHAPMTPQVAEVAGGAAADGGPAGHRPQNAADAAGGPRPAFLAPLHPLAPLLFAIASAYAVISAVQTSPRNALIAACFIAAGVPIYLFWRRGGRQARPGAAPARGDGGAAPAPTRSTQRPAER